MAVENRKKIGLVLTGGGARSAYHAGVLCALNELLENSGKKKLKFDIITGISGGAINGAYLAARAHQLPEAICDLKDRWNEISLDQIMNVSGAHILKNATRMVMQLGGGGLFEGNPTNQMFDTDPLIQYLKKNIDFKQLHHNVSSGQLTGAAVTATNYGTGSAVTFFDGVPAITPWSRSRYLSKRSHIHIKHVLASCSIPILFPPVRIQGSFYGDGGIRMKLPISPAIHMGAEKILVVGIRRPRSMTETQTLNSHVRMDSVRLSEISGVLLHSIFMDGLESDLEIMRRINTYLKIIGEKIHLNNPENLRIIPVLAIQPSKDLGAMASIEFDQLPLVFRHFMKGLGVSANRGSDILSYLAFDKTYSAKLVELGIEDVMSRREAILAWFLDE